MKLNRTIEILFAGVVSFGINSVALAGQVQAPSSPDNPLIQSYNPEVTTRENGCMPTVWGRWWCW